MVVLKEKEKAFTLAEIMIVLAITAFISIVTMKILASRSNYIHKYMYNAALKNLRMTVGNLIADGIQDPSNPTPGALIKRLPDHAHDGTKNDGFCDKAAALINTIGNVDCTKTASTSGPFTLANANFVTTNGMRFFNFGADPQSNMYTIYVDIDGARGSGTTTPGKDQDIYTFYIDRCGTFQSSADAAPVDCKGVPATCKSGSLEYTLANDQSTVLVTDSSTGEQCGSYACGKGINGKSVTFETKKDSGGVIWVYEYTYDLTSTTTLECHLLETKWECGSQGLDSDGYDKPSHKPCTL